MFLDIRKAKAVIGIMQFKNRGDQSMSSGLIGPVVIRQGLNLQDQHNNASYIFCRWLHKILIPFLI